MDLISQIRSLAEMNLSQDKFIVDLSVSSKRGPTKVSVIVDGDQGFNIDDCAELSRKLAAAMDEADLIRENYTLEVSTPGVDHPLSLKRQYVKHVGRKLKLKLKETTIEGKLTSVDEHKVVIDQETGTGKKKEIKTLDIPFSEIEKAFVMVSFK